MTTMEHLRTEINWLDIAGFSLKEQQRRVKELEEGSEVLLGVVNVAPGSVWFITSYDAETITQKKVQDKILSIFSESDNHIDFNGYVTA